MKITKATKFFSSCRTGRIEGLTKLDINKILGFKGTRILKSQGDGKVTVEWRFYVDGIPCAIWDYKGSAKFDQYSTYMPAVVGEALFGPAFSSEENYRTDI